MTDRRCDVLVQGAGPAGTLTAILLARQGHHVVLLSGSRRNRRYEGLGQRTVDVLSTFGLSHAAAALGTSVLRRVAWGGESGARNREVIVDRSRLDEAFLRDAASAGVYCLGVRRVTTRADADGPQAACELADGGRCRFAARFFVEARGRAAPRGRGAVQVGPATTALVRALKTPGPPATALESFSDGWAWAVSTGSDGYLQIFVDSAAGLPKRGDLVRRFEQLRQQLTAISGGAGGGTTRGPVTTRAAASRLAGTLVTERTIRVGDAAAAIDPLSGHGMFEAFGSALAASAAVNTMLSAPERRALAARFYVARARDGFLRNARIGRDFYRLESRWADRPFWRDRAGWPDDLPAHGDPAVPARVEMRPVVEDGLVFERPVVVTADQPRGVWRVDDVPVAELAAALAHDSGEPAPARLAAHFGVTERQLDAALRWLAAHGLAGAAHPADHRLPPGRARRRSAPR